MIRKLTTIALTSCLALFLSAGVSSAGHHEAEKPPKKEHHDHGKHEGHEKMPEHAKGDDQKGHEGHGDHHEHGKPPKIDDATK